MTNTVQVQEAALWFYAITIVGFYLVAVFAWLKVHELKKKMAALKRWNIILRSQVPSDDVPTGVPDWVSKPVKVGDEFLTGSGEVVRVVEVWGNGEIVAAPFDYYGPPGLWKKDFSPYENSATHERYGYIVDKIEE